MLDSGKSSQGSKQSVEYMCLEQDETNYMLDSTESIVRYPNELPK